MDQQETAAQFGTTDWSLMRGLAGDDDARQHAEQEIAMRYWPPIYGWFRRRGMTQEDAMDATQAFFADIIFGRKLMEQADSRQGRLRSLLLTALKHFAIDRHRASRPDQRKLHLDPADLDRIDQSISDLAPTTPDHAFDIDWDLTILAEAIRRCEDLYRLSHRLDHWRLFEHRVLLPNIHGTRPRSLAELADEFNITSPGNAAVIVHNVRKRCQDVFYQVIAETAEKHADRLDELQRIQSHLGPGEG